MANNYELVIYNNVALVKDERNITYKKGKNTVCYDNVSAEIIPSSAFVEEDFLKLKQAIFKHDIISPENLINKSVGEEVFLISDDKDGIEKERKATLIGKENGLVFNVDNRIEVGFEGRIAFNKIPVTMVMKPTLSMEIDSKKEGEFATTLNYLAKGLSWNAFYTAMITDTDDKMALSSFVCVKNASKTDYKNAKIKLIAGDVNIVEPVEVKRYETEKMMMSKAKSYESNAEEETIGEYHSYEIPEIVDIYDGENKQFLLFSTDDIEIEKEYVFNLNYPEYRSNSYNGVASNYFINFKNAKDNNLGLAMPKGLFRVYTKDKKDRAIFVGESNVKNLAEGESQKILLGKAFDINADVKVHVESTIIKKETKVIEKTDFSYEVVVKNAKKHDSMVTINKSLFLGKLVIENEKSILMGDKREWKINIKSQGEAKLVFKYSMEKEQNK